MNEIKLKEIIENVELLITEYNYLLEQPSNEWNYSRKKRAKNIIKNLFYLGFHVELDLTHVCWFARNGEVRVLPNEDRNIIFVNDYANL